MKVYTLHLIRHRDGVLECGTERKPLDNIEWFKIDKAYANLICRDAIERNITTHTRVGIYNSVNVTFKYGWSK